MDLNNLIENKNYYDSNGNRYRLLKFPFYCEEQIWCLRCPDMIQPLKCFDKKFLESLMEEE